MFSDDYKISRISLPKLDNSCSSPNLDASAKASFSDSKSQNIGKPPPPNRLPNSNVKETHVLPFENYWWVILFGWTVPARSVNCSTHEQITGNRLN